MQLFGGQLKMSKTRPVHVKRDAYDRYALIFSRLTHASLHDPHVKDFYLSNPSARNHLVQTGFLTEDACILGTSADLRQGAKVPFLHSHTLTNP